MKKQDAGKGICYLLTYALFVLLALWADWREEITGLRPSLRRTSCIGRCWRFSCCSAPTKAPGWGAKGAFLSAALFLLSLCLTVFALWQDRGWEGMILLTVE